MTAHRTSRPDPKDGRRLIALVAAAALLAGCAAPSASQVASSAPVTTASPSMAASTLERGGTLRVVVDANASSVALRDQGPSFLDPQVGLGPGDFHGSWELARCCLTRTLFSHNGRPTEEGGARLHPDIAVALADISADGLTWTIHLKEGLHYGPPLEEVEITSRDFVRSLHRLLAPGISDASFFAWDFMDIEGAGDYQAGAAASISGLEAPDDHTLVIRLDQPKGDLGALFAEPAAAPLPPDPNHPDAAFGIAEGADTGYGRFLVSSGPYMLEGSEKLDFSMPADQRKPAAGIAAGKLTLVRNPSWDPASDALRPAYADRIEIALVDSVEQAVADLDAGRADLLLPAGGNLPVIPRDLYDAFQGDPTRGRVYVNASGAVRNVIMNVAAAPFDDIHVRRALNYAIDKQHLIDLQGGPVGAQVMGHLVPDKLEDGLLRDYDPYATPEGKGDLDKAGAEMAQSKYDTDHDGRCDASACEHVRAVTRDPYDRVTEAVADDLEALGIHLEVEVVLDPFAFFDLAYDARAKIPLYVGLAFMGNYLGGAGYLLGFDGRRSISDDSGNTSLVGATAEQLRGWGYDTTEVPNVDDRVEACVSLVGSAQFECVASADQYLMENVVPWVPYSQDRYAVIASPRVLTYGFDELTGSTALDQIALKP